MLFAFIYLVLQKRQVLLEGKGEILFPVRISNLLLFLSIFSFIVRNFPFMSDFGASEAKDES